MSKQSNGLGLYQLSFFTHHLFIVLDFGIKELVRRVRLSSHIFIFNSLKIKSKFQNMIQLLQ